MNNTVRSVWQGVALLMFTLGYAGFAHALCAGGPQIYTCVDETDYRNQLVELGYAGFTEGFEDDLAWGDARSPNSLPGVTSQNIVWTPNHPLPNTITTGGGAAWLGDYGVFDPLHGAAEGTTAECDIDNPPEQCLYYDGFTGTRTAGASTLYGVGGYIRGTTGSDIEFRVGPDRIGFGKLADNAHYFFGVIDTRGFSEFQVREIEGKIGQKFIIFGDEFIFGVTDTGGGTNTAPVAVDDTAMTFEDAAVAIDVLANDSDVDGNALTVTAVTQATNGSVAIDIDRTQVSYTPDADFAGPDSFTYTIGDGNGGSATARVDVEVTAVNDAPGLDPVGDMSVAENATVAFTLFARDVDSVNLVFSASGTPIGAQLIDNGDGTADFSWTPTFLDSGNYRMTFFVTDDGAPAAQDFEEIVVTVGDVNRPPTLDPVGNLTVAENELLQVTLTAADEDGDALAFSSTVLPTGATLTDNGDGTAVLAWMPTFDQAGSFDLTLFVTDFGIPELSDSEAITITVGDVNRAPELNPIGNRTVQEGQLLEIVLIAADADAGDLLSFTSTALPLGADLTDNGDGTALFSWTTAFDQSGVYPITFFVSDNGVPSLQDFEAVSITVGDVNRPPVLDPIGSRSVLPTDTLTIVLSASDPENGALSFSSSELPLGAELIDHGDGTATFGWTPAVAQRGEHPIVFTVADAGAPVLEDFEQISILVDADALGQVVPHYILREIQLVAYPVYDYGFEAAFTNTSGKDLAMVSAQLVSVAPDTEIIDGVVTFGPVAAGATVQSNDWFTVRSGRRTRLDVGAFTWELLDAR